MTYSDVYLQHNGCRCGAPRQHRVYAYWWDNPKATRAECAKALGLKVGNVREAFHRLTKRDRMKLCPHCFKEKVLDGWCAACGYGREAPHIPVEFVADRQFPVQSLREDNGLGTMVELDALNLSNRGYILKRKEEDAAKKLLVNRVKADLMVILQEAHADQETMDLAGRLAQMEVVRLRAMYPKLASSKYARVQVVDNVIRRLKFLVPGLRNVRLLEGDGHD